MGQTYIHYDVANTLAARDYKQPQLVVRCGDDISEDGGMPQSWSASGELQRTGRIQRYVGDRWKQ